MASQRDGRPRRGEAGSIWIVSKYASSAEYGFESRLFALAREFSKRGRRVTIVASDSNHLASFPGFRSTYNKESVAGCDVVWIRTLKYAQTVSVRRVLSWLDFELKLFLLHKKTLTPPDVIIVSSLSLLTILNGLWLRRKFGCKLIFEIRDIWPLTLVAEGGYSRRNPMVRMLAAIERLGYRRSDLVVGTMPNLGAHIREVTGQAIHCECVPFGFTLAAFDDDEPLPDAYLEEHIPRDRFVIGYAGSIGLTNALETVLECARRLAQDERFYFVFLGDGDRRKMFVEQTRDLPNVTFLPKVKRTQVQSVLQRCDLLYFAVYDSPVWDFGMSLNKLIDYLMAAKPVLASYSGYQSMLSEAGCGEFLPSGDVDALQQALLAYHKLSRDELRDKGEAGRRWLIENRQWPVLAGQYLSICDTLVE